MAIDPIAATVEERMGRAGVPVPNATLSLSMATGMATNGSIAPDLTEGKRCSSSESPGPVVDTIASRSTLCSPFSNTCSASSGLISRKVTGTGKAEIRLFSLCERFRADTDRLEGTDRAICILKVSLLVRQRRTLQTNYRTAC